MYDSEKLDNALFAVVCALRGIDRDLAAMCEILGRIDQRQAEQRKAPDTSADEQGAS